ncbi:alpha/beta hydrolase [Mediterraneibacter gnavus]|uniref:alpha/beta hydrolase n=1 Tax=Mediterraneibacter gnavus TaxID=33038 RepID=UPI002330CA34|nr:alpha/beta hydrolase family protein [Mediterraneibacter gnavus]MDB8711054.1 alpha/beta hydrolase family protein [Mediterraneibacter gnavus]MDB8714330.1 alpha/beta hydrolase family protein [Mediterraneibacter gnavus]
MAVLQMDFVSQCLMRTVTVKVIIPLDKIAKMNGEKAYVPEKFKTLYLLHGMLGNHTDWIDGTRIQRWAQEKNLAVVMPAGENRFYVDNPREGAYFGEFIGKELVEFTRKMFPLSDRREDTFIAGLSMGGYGAIRNGLKYHDTFSHIAGLSSGIMMDDILNSDNDSPMPFMRRSYYESVFGDLDKLPGSDMDCEALILDLKKKEAQIPRMYLCCGTEDFLVEKNRAYRDFLRNQGVDLIYEKGSGTHSWDFWDTYIQRVLEWLPLDETSKGLNSGNVGVE